MTWRPTRGRGVVSLNGQSISADSSAENGAMQWPWKFAQGTSGPLWIAFRYVDTEPVIGCYDPNSQQLDLIKVGDQTEGRMSYSTARGMCAWTIEACCG